MVKGCGSFYTDNKYEEWNKRRNNRSLFLLWAKGKEEDNEENSCCTIFNLNHYFWCVWIC
jgi:hypothetical protein